MATQTYTQWKRDLKVGDRFYVVDHWRADLIGTYRTITKVQTERFVFKQDGKEEKSWSDFEKAASVSLDGDLINVHPAPGVFWTLRKLS